jgi:diadenosine tetraphosphate (Ap4A) HIT family hydrolase
MTCEYCGKGGYGKVITEKTFWTVFLAPSQRYLGTCVVAIKRPCRNLSELKDVEWKEFSEIVREMEVIIGKLFKPTLFNWSCFKNAAFRTELPHPEVHWHLIPRYKDPVNYGGIKFVDVDFGYIPQPIKHEVSLDIILRMLKEIKDNMND